MHFFIISFEVHLPILVFFVLSLSSPFVSNFDNISRYIFGTDKLRPNAFEVRGMDGSSTGTVYMDGSSTGTVYIFGLF